MQSWTRYANLHGASNIDDDATHRSAAKIELIVLFTVEGHNYMIRSHFPVRAIGEDNHHYGITFSLCRMPGWCFSIYGAGYCFPFLNSRTEI